MGEKTKTAKEAAPVNPAPQVTTGKSESTESEPKFPSYVVTREGHRVSPMEYSTPNDPAAVEEREYWKKIATRHSWGEKVEIVAYDNKLHRIW